MRANYERHANFVSINGTDLDGDEITIALSIDDAERLAEDLMDAVNASREETDQ